ncbi:MAG: hypothetical protein ACRC92_27510 [Peptostreptococcaceae bacterium]
MKVFRVYIKYAYVKEPKPLGYALRKLSDVIAFQRGVSLGTLGWGKEAYAVRDFIFKKEDMKMEEAYELEKRLKERFGHYIETGSKKR